MADDTCSELGAGLGLTRPVPGNSLSQGSAQSWMLLLRISLLMVFFVLQIEVVETLVRRYFDSSNILDSTWKPFLAYRLHFFSFVIVFPAALLLIIWQRCREHYVEFIGAAADYRWMRWLAVQLICYASFAFLTYQLSVNPDYFSGATTPVLTIWAVLFLATGVSWLLTLAPASFWLGFLTSEKGSLALAALVAIVAASFTVWLRGFTPELAVATLHGVHLVVGLLFDPVVFDIATRSIGTVDFSVQVSNDCAGYEGIALVTIFVAIYLWLFRRDFRFPWALLAFPIGIAVIWVFNVLRIAALIWIGDSVSEEVALAGFHSNAGWIAFLVVTIGLIALLHKVPLFARQCSTGEVDAGKAAHSPIVEALLLPFIILLASSLLLGALSAGFDQLYPFKVVAVGAVLWYFRRVYQFSSYRISAEPILVGILVFIAWMLLVPVSAEQSESYTAQFTQWSPTVVVVWIVFRFMGSVVTVPLAEELAFRGYLLPRLGGHLPAVNSPIGFNLFAFVVSSVVFGLLHGAWLAGIFAGMAYAWIRYRRGLLGDAVLAHMTTNLLLSGYVLATQQWSYW